MRVSRAYGSASDVYTLQNSYLNNSEHQVDGGYKFYSYTEVRQTCVHCEILSQVGGGSKFHAHTEEGQTCIPEKLRK